MALEKSRSSFLVPQLYFDVGLLKYNRVVHWFYSRKKFLVHRDRLGAVKCAIVQIKINHVNNGYRADDIYNLDFLKQECTS